MIKIGTSKGNVLVTLTPVEFLGLAGKSHADSPDGDSISLARIKRLTDLVDDNKNQLQEVKQEATELVQAINSLVT